MGRTATAIEAANEIRDNDDNTAVVYINAVLSIHVMILR